MGSHCSPPCPHTQVAAQLGRGSLGAYVISMTKGASDVLAVELLQREARMHVRASGGWRAAGQEVGVIKWYRASARGGDGAGGRRRMVSVHAGEVE